VTENTSKRAITAPILIINGVGFDPTAAGNTVALNLDAVGEVTAATMTSLTVKLSTRPTSTGPLTAVVTSYGAPSGAPVQVATVVDAPTVSAHSAQMARTAPSLAVTGSGFDPTAAGNRVDFNLGAVGTVTAATATQLTVTLSAQPNATGPLTAVVNSFGGSSGAAVQVATVVDAPSVNASSALLARTAPTIVIKGTFFDPTPAGNRVDFNLGAVGTVTAATTTQLTVTLSTQPTSNGPLTAVVTALGGSSGAAVQVGTVVDPPIVAAGDTHSCARTLAGDVVCFGSNSNSKGELDVPRDLGGVKYLSLGSHYTLALRLDNKLVCWGDCPAGMPEVVQSVSAGRQHACAVLLDGLAKCWGDNSYNQLLGPSPRDDWPQYKALAAAARHTCGVATDATVWCWGDDTYGQSEIPAYFRRGGKVKSVGVGNWFTAVSEASSGQVVVWGLDQQNQLVPPFWLGAVESLSSGAYFLCARAKANGWLRCWGSNLKGQLNVPPDLGPVVSFSAGTYHVCATTLYGAIRCWGDNQYGQSTVPADINAREA
jgi:hypothetical protein